MGGTLFFVHGTGVRQERYDALSLLIKERARRNDLQVQFVGCPWGANVGVKLDRIDETLPPAPATRSVGDQVPTPAELEVAEWSQLLDDPLIELRIVGQERDQRPRVVVGATRPDQEAVTMLRGLRERPPDVSGSGLDIEELAKAADEVASTAELAAAATAAGTAADGGLIEVTSRAVVATALAAHEEDPAGPPLAALDHTRRDALVRNVAAALAPNGTKGIDDWARKRIKNFAAGRATKYARTRRDAVTASSMPGVGDILYYQRRGEAIADYVADAMSSLEKPVVAVGHSLGGIILIDLLSGRNPPHVDALVTVGSQSPVLFAIDALANLRAGNPDGKPFVPWLNIYDRNDLLSYCAAPIFARLAGIRDEEVDSRVPFPEAHSAYWANDRVYELIKTVWPCDDGRD